MKIYQLYCNAAWWINLDGSPIVVCAHFNQIHLHFLLLSLFTNSFANNNKILYYDAREFLFTSEIAWEKNLPSRVCIIVYQRGINHNWYDSSLPQYYRLCNETLIFHLNKLEGCTFGSYELFPLYELHGVKLSTVAQIPAIYDFLMHGVNHGLFARQNNVLPKDTSRDRW